MNLEPVLSLLTVPPGNLTYHLIVLFSISVGLIGAFRIWLPSGDVPSARVAIGLGILLFFRLALFLLILVGNPVGIDTQLFLPPLLRGLAALEIALIAWLWTFQKPNRSADFSILFLALLILVSLTLTIILWTGQSAYFSFNEVWLAAGWDVIALFLAGLGSIRLAGRRPEGWGLGLGMLVALGMGHVLQLLLVQQGDLAGIVRLAEIAVYPVLIMLPQTPESASQESAPPFPAKLPRRERYRVDANTLESMFRLAAEDDLDQLCKNITKTVSYATLADVCFLISVPDARGDLNLYCGFDLVLEKNLSGANLASGQLPTITSAIERKRPLRLPVSSTAVDLVNLQRAFGHHKSGPLLLVPIVPSDGLPLGAIGLLSPYSDRKWGIEEEKVLARISHSLAEIIQRNFERSQKAASLADLQAELERLHSRVAEDQVEKKALEETIVELESKIAPGQGAGAGSKSVSAAEAEASYDSDAHTELVESLQAKLESLTAEYEAAQVSLARTSAELDTLRELSDLDMGNDLRKEVEEKKLMLTSLQMERDQLQDSISKLETDQADITRAFRDLDAAHQEALASIQALMEENRKLNTDLATARSETIAAATAVQVNSQNHLEEELRAALRQLANLQNELGESEIKLMQLERIAGSQAHTYQKWQLMLTLAQDLRQPMSSIVGYSDFLLSEAVGILGALQKKFLDRVRSSVERMNIMIDDMIQIAARQAGQVDLSMEVLDLSAIIDHAIAATRSQFAEKSLVLRVDFPDNLPQIEGDREALQLSLIHLLNNAGDVSEDESEISLRATSESFGDDLDYLHIQITDSGPGIAEENFEAVFEEETEGSPPIQGLGNSRSGLIVARSMVESHGGRIWLESEDGAGSTFNVLLPLFQRRLSGMLESWS